MKLVVLWLVDNTHIDLQHLELLTWIHWHKFEGI